MTQYKCIKRLTTDQGKTIHEVGEVIDLSEDDAKSALKQSAVVAVDVPAAKGTKSTAGGDSK